MLVRHVQLQVMLVTKIPKNVQVTKIPKNVQALLLRFAAVAITPTDLVTKSVAIETEVGGALIRIGGMVKGSGMIHPIMATMLGVVTPDASIASTVWREMVRISINRSFNQITVERLARECCFFHIQSFPFDESNFGKLSERRSTSRPMQASLPVLYVFHMHPSSDIAFGDYNW